MLRKRNNTQDEHVTELGAMLAAAMAVMLDPPAIALHQGIDPLEHALDISFQGEGHRWRMTLRYDGLSDEAVLKLGDSKFLR